MNYEEFCAALQEELFNILDTGYSIHREHVLKNNGVVLDSLALLKAGKHCSPVISLERVPCSRRAGKFSGEQKRLL